MIYPQNFEQKIGFDNIRHMLKENPSEPKYILTELGIGYRMLEDNP